MRQTNINFILILIISTIVFFVLSYNASLDNQYILSLLIIVVIQLSLILAILLKSKNR